MVVALDPDECFEYVLLSERDAQGSPLPDATTWRLRFLRGRTFDVVARTMGRIAKQEEESGDASTMEHTDEVLRLGLRGWSNFRDSRGQPVLFPPLVEGEVLGLVERWLAPVEAIARIPSAQIKIELLTAMLAGQRVSLDDAKKSSSPQR